MAWHRAGFRLFWTWKVRRGQPGRPVISREVRDLIRRMCRENPGWGAPRIHGELLKLGIDIGESSVSKYMVRCRKPPSQTWRTFLENHAQQLVSIDFFTVPTLRFQVLYVFLVLAHDRRRILHFNVTAHPTAEFEQELRLLKDGEYRWQLIQYNPLKDESGDIVHWNATATDIDDQKRTEERLRNENLVLREQIDRDS